MLRRIRMLVHACLQVVLVGVTTPSGANLGFGSCLLLALGYNSLVGLPCKNLRGKKMASWVTLIGSGYHAAVVGVL